MIKDQMTLEEVQYGNFKGTGSINGLSNEEVLPYTVGYIPSSMIESSTLFNIVKGDVSTAAIGYTGDYSFVYSPAAINTPSKGIPFAYGFGSGQIDSSIVLVQEDGAWIKPNDWYAGNVAGLLSNYKTSDEEGILSNMYSNIVFYVVVLGYNEATGNYDAQIVISSGVTASLDLLTYDFTATYTISNRNSFFNGYTVTITKSDLESANNGVMELDGGEWTTTTAGTRKVKILAVATSVTFNNPSSYVKSGVVLSDNFRMSLRVPEMYTNIYSQFNSRRANQYSAVKNIATIAQNCRYQVAVENVEGGLFSVYAPATAWEAHYFACGLTLTDIQILTCIYHPLYKIDGEFYVAEFTESYEITGRLIPLEEAADWQKDLNGDKNKFDSDDIPSEGGGGGGDPEGVPDEGSRGAGIDYDVTLFAGGPDCVRYGLFDSAALRTLFNQLWDKPDGFFESLKVAADVNPMDYFLSLRSYPLPIQGGGTSTALYIGRGGELDVTFETTGVQQLFDFGSVTVPRYYNNFLDYSPYTTVKVYIPYCGLFEINPTIVMGRTIGLKLAVSLADGSGTWYLYNATDNQPLLVKQCQIAQEFPIASLNASQMGANIANASLQSMGHAISYAEGAFQAAATAFTSAQGGGTGGNINLGPSNASVMLTSLTDAFNKGMASKEIVEMTGGSTGGSASPFNAKPYIIIDRSLHENPSNYGHTVGYLVNKTYRVSGLSGFTTVRNVDVSGLSATGEEKERIKRLMETGFYA